MYTSTYHLKMKLDPETKERLSQLEMQLQEAKERENNLRKLNDSLANALRDTDDHWKGSGKREMEILIERHNESMSQTNKKHTESIRFLTEEVIYPLFQNTSLRNRIQEMENWRRNNFQDSEAMLEKVQREVAEKNSHIASLNIRIEKLQNENLYYFCLNNRGLKTKLQEANSISTSSYNNLRITELVSEKSTLISQVNTLNTRLSELSLAYESRARIYDTKVAELEGKVAHLSSERNEQAREIDSLKEFVSVKEAEVGFYRARSVRTHRNPTEGVEEKTFSTGINGLVLESNGNFHSVLESDNRSFSRNLNSPPPEKRRKPPQVALINLNENFETLETNLSIDTSIRDRFFSPSPRVSKQFTRRNVEAKVSPKNTSRRKNSKGGQNEGKNKVNSSRAFNTTVHSRTKSANMTVSKTPKKSLPAKGKNTKTGKKSENNLKSTAVFGNIGTVECRNCQRKFSFPSFVSHSDACHSQDSSQIKREFRNILKEKNIPLEQHDDLITKFFEASETPCKGRSKGLSQLK